MKMLSKLITKIGGAKMILYSEEEGLIKAKGIKKLDGTRDANYKLPHIAVGVFSEYLLEDIVKNLNA